MITASIFTDSNKVVLYTCFLACSNFVLICEIMIESPFLNGVSRKMIYWFVLLLPLTVRSFIQIFSVESEGSKAIPEILIFEAVVFWALVKNAIAREMMQRNIFLR